MISRAPEGLTLAERTDLYWAHEYVSGGKVAWAPAAPESLTTFKARQRFRALLDGRSGSDALTVLAAVDAWGIVSGEHLALMTGNSAFTRRSKVLTELLALGVIEVGAPAVWDMRKTKLRFYRRSMSGPLGRLTSVLTEDELTAVRGDTTTWSTPSGHDRHDLLALETALRVAEFHEEFEVVLGEKHSKAMDLRGKLCTEQYHHRGDATLVRDDGFKIVIELTSSRTEHLDAKISRWARWMRQSNDMRYTGVFVLFVCAPHPVKREHSTVSQMKRLIDKELVGELAKSKGSTRLRFGVVEWAEWFDAPGSTTVAFEDLMVWHSLRKGVWKQYPLAGTIYDLDYTAPVDNLLKTHGPTWLK